MNPEIHMDVLIHSPINLVKVVSLAKVYEEKYTQTQTQNYSKPPKSPNTYPQQPNRALFSPNKNETNHKIGNPPLLQTPPPDQCTLTKRTPISNKFQQPKFNSEGTKDYATGVRKNSQRLTSAPTSRS